MIVQTTLEGHPHFVMRMSDHALACGQLAAAFGNALFEPLNPMEPMVYVVAHHDEGWVSIDAQVIMDPSTGLPYHLTETPLPYLLQTSAGSPAFNERHHPLSGMMSSMHTVGLFHGRYGISDRVFIETIPDEYRADTDKMLLAEFDRQDKLKELLEMNPETAVFVPDNMLFHNYKRLQFFDTLALYFQTTHESGRLDTFFENVPRSVGDDVVITIKYVEPSVYALSPFPFRKKELVFSYWGRYMNPHPLGTDLKAIMATAELKKESVTLVAG